MIEIPVISPHIVVATAVFFAVLLVGMVVYAKANPAQLYAPLPSILSQGEQQFYRALSSALDGRVIITCKVRIADVLKVKRHREHKAFWGEFSKISQKHFDFVLLEKTNFSTIATLELDDRSHSKLESRATDNFKNRIMHQAGIPLHRFKAKKTYNRAAILEELAPSLNGQTITK